MVVGGGRKYLHVVRQCFGKLTVSNFDSMVYTPIFEDIILRYGFQNNTLCTDHKYIENEDIHGTKT